MHLGTNVIFDLLQVANHGLSPRRLEAYASNRGSWRQLIAKGAGSYEEAKALWIAYKGKNQITRYS